MTSSWSPEVENFHVYGLTLASVLCRREVFTYRDQMCQMNTPMMLAVSVLLWLVKNGALLLWNSDEDQGEWYYLIIRRREKQTIQGWKAAASDRR